MSSSGSGSRQTKALHGPASSLISRITYLKTLLKNLPTTLPDCPLETTYHFGLDNEDMTDPDKGIWYACNHNLEVCFETWKLREGEPIQFTERGIRLEDSLIKQLTTVVKDIQDDAQRGVIRDAWIERLIVAAKAAGARAPYVSTAH